jgi:hypothetical protein
MERGYLGSDIEYLWSSMHLPISWSRRYRNLRDNPICLRNYHDFDFNYFHHDDFNYDHIINYDIDDYYDIDYGMSESWRVHVSISM